MHFEINLLAVNDGMEVKDRESMASAATTLLWMETFLCSVAVHQKRFKSRPMVSGQLNASLFYWSPLNCANLLAPNWIARVPLGFSICNAIRFSCPRNACLSSLEADCGGQTLHNSPPIIKFAKFSHRLCSAELLICGKQNVHWAVVGWGYVVDTCWAASLNPQWCNAQNGSNEQFNRQPDTKGVLLRSNR